MLQYDTLVILLMFKSACFSLYVFLRIAMESTARQKLQKKRDALDATLRVNTKTFAPLHYKVIINTKIIVILLIFKQVCLIL